MFEYVWYDEFQLCHYELQKQAGRESWEVNIS